VPSTVRNSRNSARAADSNPSAARWRVLAALGWSYRDVLGLCAAIIACGAILANVLFMQAGRHPAPLFRSERTASAPAPFNPSLTKEIPVVTIPSRPAGASTQKVEQATPSRPGAEIVADMQRELGRRGYYDGVVDGRYGPRTIAAIREFEQSAGMKPSTEPSEALLQAIKRSSAKPSRPTTTASTGGTPGRSTPQPARNELIGTVLAPSKRVLAVQRALSDYGYGQIKPTGIVDAETQIAIEKFERERKLPITGQPSDRVVRELAAIIGRPLE
jgi:peptidoglycan hydrolase-like protein with peptidoglycan-binding domain